MEELLAHIVAIGKENTRLRLLIEQREQREYSAMQGTGEPLHADHAATSDTARQVGRVAPRIPPTSPCGSHKSNSSLSLTASPPTSSHLEHHSATKVQDLLQPPEQGEYQNLEDEQIRRFTPSREQQLRQLLSNDGPGTCRHSSFCFTYERALALRPYPTS